jgi:hypothetical protein
LADESRFDTPIFLAPNFQKFLLDILAGEVQKLQSSEIVNPFDVSLEGRKIRVKLF